jgi:hypothetical protein
MALVIVSMVMFVAGVVALGTLQWASRHLARPLALPLDVVNGIFTGIGFLITIPFVFSVFLEAHVSILTSLIVGAAILFCAALAFAYSVFRLLVPVLKAEFARG